MSSANRNKHNNQIGVSNEDSIDKALDKSFERANFQEWFAEDHKALNRRYEKLKKAVSETATMMNSLCNEMGVKLQQSIEEDDDDDDVLIVGDNLEFLTNKISVGSRVLVKKNFWYPGVVVNRDYLTFEDIFNVKLDIDPSSIIRALSNQIAFIDPPTSPKADVGSRVVAFSHYKNQWLSGVIGEHPRVQNKKRYLVFLDDGTAQYSENTELRLVLEARDPVWEDIEDPEVADYIKSYLDLFPNIPTLKSSPGTRLRILKDNRWLRAEAMEIDATMMRVVYTESSSPVSEWVYRGSRRLEPLNREFNTFQKRSRTARFSTASRSKRPYVVYTIIQDEDDDPLEMIDLDPCEPTHQGDTNDTSKTDKREEGKVENLANKKKETKEDTSNSTFDSTEGHLISTSQYVSPPIANRIRKKPGKFHVCKQSCLMSGVDYTGHIINPLMIPMKHGWDRSVKIASNGHKKFVVYTSYCGMSLRCIDEVDACLFRSNSPLTIEQFSFDPNLDELTEFVLKKFVNDERQKNLEIKDYSLGREKVPVPCVNSVDTEMPPFLEYTTARVPGLDVHIETRPEFLAGCSCTDGCRDRSKCECIQFTVAETNEKNSKAGYTDRRLKKPMKTGIYECNANCSCDYRCHNRVVQNGLTLKLQIFKTEKKGWGLRSLNDIPAGQFICHYTGQVLTDEVANQEGKMLGDEYLADLDYIEVVEQRKEGFEREIYEGDGVYVGREDDEEEEDDGKEGADDDSDKDSSFRPTSVDLKRKRNSKKGTTDKTPKKKSLSIKQLSTDSATNSLVTFKDFSYYLNNIIDSTGSHSNNNNCNYNNSHNNVNIVSGVEKSNDDDSINSGNNNNNKDNGNSNDSNHINKDSGNSNDNNSNFNDNDSNSNSINNNNINTNTITNHNENNDNNNNNGKEKVTKSDGVEPVVADDIMKTSNVDEGQAGKNAFLINNIEIKELRDDKSFNKDVKEANGAVVPVKSSPAVVKKASARKKTGGSRQLVNKKPKQSTKDLMKSVTAASKEFRRRLMTRELLGDQGMYIVDTKYIGNLGRYVNHSCSPNMFVQNVFVDTHDLRFPWVAFFSLKLIKAGSELTWDYGYEVGSVDGKQLFCHCGSTNCSGRLL